MALQWVHSAAVKGRPSGHPFYFAPRSDASCIASSSAQQMMLGAVGFSNRRTFAWRAGM
jgi:hypothetical protein